MSFGKPNYGDNKNFKKKNNFNTSKGDVIAHILPPWGTLKEAGNWWVKHAVHFGYKNTEGKFRPFESPLKETYNKETKTYTTIVPDAALDRLKDLQAKLVKAKEEKNEQAEKALTQLVGFGGTYNIDRNVHMNVVLLDGRAGELKIRKKMFDALLSEIDNLREKGDAASDFKPVDPLSVEAGRFFVFHKEGTGNDTTFKVTVYNETLDIPNVGKVSRPFVSKIGADVLARLDSELHNLDGLFPRLTAEEVAKIVSTSDLRTGRSPAINEFIDNRWKANRAAKDAAEKTATAAATTPTTATTTTTPVEVKAAPTTTTLIAKPATVETQVGALKEQLAQPTAAAQPTYTQPVDQMSDEDFFKQLEAQ